MAGSILRGRRGEALRVVALITVRQATKFFAVKRCAAVGGDETIRHDVVKVVAGSAAWVAQVSRLQTGWAMTQDARPAPACVDLHLHQQI